MSEKSDYEHQGFESCSTGMSDRAAIAAEKLGPGQPTLKRRMKNLGKRGIRNLFELGQRCGVDLLPRHFYSEVPDIRDLRRDLGWRKPRTMVGIGGVDVASQFEFLESCCTPERVASLRTDDVYGAACTENGEPGFGPVDAEFLACFLTATRPGKIVQVGCGVSTAIMLSAARKAANFEPEIVCVEPYPTEFLKDAQRAGQLRLVEEKAQSVDLETFTQLSEGDLLFVDSTHAVRPGSEVNRLIMEVLPRLDHGVWVHFHDIYFPYDYQRGILDDELFFSNETALLHAFLINNSACEIRASLSMLHYADPSRLGRSLPGYRPAENDQGLRKTAGHFPASIYLRTT